MGRRFGVARRNTSRGFYLLLRGISGRYMYARGRSLGAREAWRWRVREAWQEMSYASESITTWGPVAYRYISMRSIHTHTHTKCKRKGERVNVRVRDERENIESLRRNIVRCVIHERASDSRRVNSLWIDVIKQKNTQKNSKLRGVILLRTWYRIAYVFCSRLSSRV